MRALRDLTLVQLFVAMAVLVLVGEMFANLAGEDSSFGAFIGLSLFGIAVGGALIFGLIPRVIDSASPALVLSVLALVTVVVFWTALPFALGVPALYLGARASGREENLGVYTVGIAGAAILAGLVMCVIG